MEGSDTNTCSNVVNGKRCGQQLQSYQKFCTQCGYLTQGAVEQAPGNKLLSERQFGQHNSGGCEANDDKISHKRTFDSSFCDDSLLSGADANNIDSEGLAMAVEQNLLLNDYLTPAEKQRRITEGSEDLVIDFVDDEELIPQSAGNITSLLTLNDNDKSSAKFGESKQENPLLLSQPARILANSSFADNFNPANEKLYPFNLQPPAPGVPYVNKRTHEESQSEGGKKLKGSKCDVQHVFDVYKPKNLFEGGSSSREDEIGFSGASNHQEKAYRKPIQFEDFIPATYKQPRLTRLASMNQAAICITFHMAISSKWQFDPARNHQAFIVFGSERFGGWRCRDHIMHITEIKICAKEKDILYLMAYTVPVPKEVLLRGLQYKYYIDADFSQYEVFPGQYYSQNRELCFAKEVLNETVDWNQYDGVAFPEITKGFLSFFDDFILNETLTSFRGWLPHWSEDCNSNVGIAYFRSIAYVGDACFMSLNVLGLANKCRQFCEAILDTNVKPIMASLSSGKLADSQRGDDGAMRLASALLVVGLMVKYSLKYDADKLAILCQALMLRCDTDACSCSEYDTLMRRHIGANNVEEVDTMLQEFVAVLKNAPFVENWPCIIPLLHFVTKSSQSGIATGTDIRQHCAHGGKWWGIVSGDLQVLVNRSKSNDLSLEKYLNLVQLFKLDDLLPRTLLAAAKLNRVVELARTTCFPPDALIANLCFWLKVDTNARNDGAVAELAEAISEVLRLMLQQTDNKLLNFVSSNKNVTSIAQISLEMMKMFVEIAPNYYTCKNKDNLLALLGVCIHTLNLLQSVQHREEAVSGATLHLLAIYICRMLEQTKMWLYRCFPSLSNASISYDFGNVENEVKLCSELLNLTFLDEATCKAWQLGILKLVSERLDAIQKPEKKIELFCRLTFDGCNPLVEESFSVEALKVIERVSQDPDADLQFLFYGGCDISRVQDLIYGLVDKVWPKTCAGQPSTDDMDILKQLINHKSFSLCINAFGKAMRNQENNETCLGRYSVLIVQAYSLFEHQVNTLLSGAIPMRLLKTVLTNVPAFVDVCITFNSNLVAGCRHANWTEESMRGHLECVLSQRQEELAFLQKHREWARDLETLCNSMEVDVRELQQFGSGDLSDVSINQCVSTAVSGNCRKPCFVGCSLSPAVLASLPSVAKLSQSILFIKLFWRPVYSRVKQRLRANSSSSALLTLDQVVAEILLPAEQLWLHLSTQLQQGTAKFSLLDHILAACNNNLQRLEQELKLMVCNNDDTSADWCMQRMKQIKEYVMLKTYKQGAQILSKCRHNMGLNGDFRELDILCAEQADNDRTLRDVTDDLIKAGRELKDVDKAKFEAISTFASCGDIVSWLRKNVEDLKHVKTLVDLAMITAEGQGDMEVSKVSCLHAAVLGYAPLIYELDDKCNFLRFLQKCQAVWKALEADRHLPMKLIDINRDVKWVQNIKESHGSVELNALQQVEAINTRGKYLVGCIGCGKFRTIDDVIKLKLKETNRDSTKHITQPDERCYTVTQLDDLQSKLMLVAGQAHKGKEHIARFVEILDGIKRLAQLYMRICSSGNVLFHSWKATFKCDEAASVKVIIDFGLGDAGQVLKSDQTDVKQQIADLCTFFESSLEEWMKHVAGERTVYVDLNYFTTEQLLILRQEIAKFIHKDAHFDNRIYHLLHFVKPRCSEADIRKAWQMASKELYGESEKSFAVLATTSAVAHEEMAVKERIADNFLPEPSATQHAGSARIDDRNEDKNGDDTEYNEVVESEMDPVPCMSLKYFTTSLLEDSKLHRSSIQVVLEGLWTNYLHNVTTSVMDYISVNHLGMLLKELHKLSLPAVETVHRRLPPYLKQGVPNLIVCPNADVHTTVLSVYMTDPKLPLPGADEVLLCTEHTTLEDVELLWRRATAVDNGGKIYCLVDADKLDYDVAEKVERKLDYLLHGGYRLVMVCNKENEDKALLVTVFDKYRVPHPFVEKTSLVRDYLQAHYIVCGNAKSAAKIDAQGLSVRVISSWRAGVGKTLCCQNYTKMLKAINLQANCVGIQLQEVTVDVSQVLDRLLEHVLPPGDATPHIFHIDIAHLVEYGVDYLLFNLLVLGSLTDRRGYLWRKSDNDLYLVETLPLMFTASTEENRPANQNVQRAPYVHHIFHLLPSLTCWSPRDCLDLAKNNVAAIERRHPFATVTDFDQRMDNDLFESQLCQRPYQYLSLHVDKQKFDLNPYVIHGTTDECVKCLTRWCGVNDPTWSELRHFLSFLNTQLLNCEQSSFCHDVNKDILPGFMFFVVRFMIQMSRDFSTRSLDIAEESPRIQQNFWDSSDDNDSDDEILAGPREEDADEQMRLLYRDEDADYNARERNVLNELLQHGLRRRWETSPHPYIFFNEDRESMTFLGFYVSGNGDIIDPLTGNVLIQNAIPRLLQQGLICNRVPLNENFDGLNRAQKLYKLCMVMGIEYVHDPDPTYELTTDNVKKMLAIFMRFSCDIPVIIMGETGCGKTRLIKFLCDLYRPVGIEESNLILMKVHGGTTANDIIKKVHLAARITESMTKNSHEAVMTVLFFDEANTTEAISLIKEIVTDKTIQGRLLPQLHGLKIIAACNPYRRHTDDMIKRLEHAGLGYHVQAKDTKDRLGRIPMRQLVYRVQSLPQSLCPLVWDFGQLSTDVEQLYIRQMVNRYIAAGVLSNLSHLTTAISDVLACSQNFMRQQKDECSFVSLRDVLRVLDVMAWFLEHDEPLFQLMDDKLDAKLQQDIKFSDTFLLPAEQESGSHMSRQAHTASAVHQAPDTHSTRQAPDTRSTRQAPGTRSTREAPDTRSTRQSLATQSTCQGSPEASLCHDSGEDDEIPTKFINEQQPDACTLGVDKVSRALILALGVCYHARLEDRQSYREKVAASFKHPLILPEGEKTIFDQINSCQDVFLDQVLLGENIARNQALKENVFMMVVCIELRIPLFLVGKPGSSKSLAKTIVADAMQRDAAHMPLFRGFKLAHMVSYQCSPLSTPEGIVGMFRQCAKLQEGKDLDTFVSVVVLDEIGLAEDSPRMPLKTLHPLLEDGCEGDEEVAAHKKVAFIGISNWALDPAKMNRGILVQRGVPDERELIDSAKGICGNNENNLRLIESLLEPLSKAYLDIYMQSKESVREFFGLRDFYSLMKMVLALAQKTDSKPTWSQLVYAIKRNFGGLADIDPVKIFEPHFDAYSRAFKNDEFDTPSELIDKSLFGDGLPIQSRYLLVLTENYAAFNILDKYMPRIKNCQVIFGSSFPRDQEYTQVCRNINRIKVCMEMGQCVILLDLEKLYESLYDAMNQYYVYLGGQKFVDLGLGTHRVKCRVHNEFRMIVVAEKSIVYDKFPIPLINRLEKHFLAMNTMLSRKQKEVVDRLKKWAEGFTQFGRNGSNQRERKRLVKVEDVFIGYHADCAASIVLQVCHHLGLNKDITDDTTTEEVFDQCKKVLLQCATPESIVRYTHPTLTGDAVTISDTYFKRQTHDSLQQFLTKHIRVEEPGFGVFAQITTHSRMMSKDEVSKLRIAKDWSTLKFLQSFDTEQQLCREIRDFVEEMCKVQRKDDTLEHRQALMIFQCESGNKYQNLIACTSYNIVNEFNQLLDQLICLNITINVLLIIHLPRKSGGCFVGFQGGRWLSYHIDDLMPLSRQQLPLEHLQQLTMLSKLFEFTPTKVTMSLDATTSNTLGNVESDTVDIKNSALHVPSVSLSQFYALEVSTYQPSRVINQNALEEAMDARVTSEEDSKKHFAPTRSLSQHTVASEGQSSSFQFPAVCSTARDEAVIAIRNVSHRVEAETVKSSHVLEIEKQRQYADAVIISCLHSALAMIKDVTNSLERKTRRIEILQQLFSAKTAQSGERGFMLLFQQRIYLLLKEKEEQASIMEIASAWLSREAASVDRVNKMGTFRRAVQNYLECKTAPLVAAVTAMVDCENNLDLLVDHPPGHFIHDMWLDILADSDISQLTYMGSLQSVLQRGELTEITMSKHSAGELFYCRLPFSWLVKQHIDKILNSARKQNSSKMNTVEDNAGESTAALVFLDSKLGKIVARAAAKSSWNVIIKLYVHDYTRFVYAAQSSTKNEEYKIVENLLLSLSSLEKRTLVDIHTAFDEYKVMLSNLAFLLQNWRQGLEYARNWAVDENTNNLINAELIDVRLLWALLHYLSPSKAQMDNSSQEARQTWHQLVDTLEPVVHRLLTAIESSVVSSEQSSRAQAAVNCRSLWTKICTLQLYIRYMCQTDTSKGVADSIKLTWPLWSILKDPVNYKTDKTLNQVEKFIHLWHRIVRKRLFQEKEMCAVCENDPDLISMPCGHSMCVNCVRECGNEGNSPLCPVCRMTIPTHFNIKLLSGADVSSKVNKDIYMAFKLQCNSFFMDLVMRFCFAEGQPPGAEVVEKLLGYITWTSKIKDEVEEGEEGKGDVHVTTRQMNVLGGAIDPTPTMRSFLLQLLLRYSSETVQQHLNTFFMRAQKIVTNKCELTELCIMCIYCFEDYYYSQHSEWSKDKVVFIRHLLNTVLNTDVSVINFGLQKLEWLALARFTIDIVASWMKDVFIDACQPCGHVLESLSLIEKLCNRADLCWPRIYLLKQLHRRFGANCVVQLSQLKSTKWIVPEALRNETEPSLPDFFIVSSDQYRTVRQFLELFITEGNVTELKTAFQALPVSDCMKEYLLLLAAFEVFVSSGTRCEVDSEKTKKVIPLLMQFCIESSFIQHKDVVQLVVHNQVTRRCSQLTVHYPMDSADHSLATILAHLKIVTCLTVNSNIIDLLKNIIAQPQQMTTSYLPTMPQDLKLEALAILRTRGDGRTMYYCPNGHPYVIGNCGQPMQVAQCKECGSEIGGINHKLSAGNKAISEMDDTSKTGHCLGLAAQQQRHQVTSERQLTPVSTALVRCLLHAAMLLGAESNIRAIAGMVHPPVREAGVIDFLVEHLRVDLHNIATIIGRSPDDAVLLVHMVLSSIGQQRKVIAKYETGLAFTQTLLPDKQSRECWESEFQRYYLQPILHDLADNLNAAQRLVANDTKLFNNPLMRMLYEVKQAQVPERLDDIHNSLMVWRQRERVSVEEVAHRVTQLTFAIHHISSNTTSHPKLALLAAFLKEEPLLQSVYYLPNVVRLQQLLVRQFTSKLDYNEAIYISIADVIDKMSDGLHKVDIDYLVTDYITVWNTVRHKLSQFMFDHIVVPKDYCDMDLTRDSHLAFFLPSIKGQCLCALALVRYLAKLQNDFMEKYCTLRKCEIGKSIEVQHAAAASLISFQRERDLFPLIVANCNYSFCAGKSVSIEYDFDQLEKQVEERFIRGRSRLLPAVEVICFREDITNVLQFAQLGKHIPQEALPVEVQQEIQNDLNHLPTLSDMLNSLDIAIGFLVSIGGEPATSLIDFLKEKLHMKTGVFIPKVRQCRLSHVRALWLVLSHRRAVVMVTNGQEPFSTVDEAYCKDLENDMRMELKAALKHMNQDMLSLALYTCIMLKLVVPKNRDDEDYVDDVRFPLGYMLNEFWTIEGNEPIAALAEDGCFPSSILVEHSVATWLALVTQRD